MPTDVFSVVLDAHRPNRGERGKTILVLGGPGSGKLTLAAQLARRWYPVIGAECAWQTQDAVDPTIRKLRSLELDAATPESASDTRRIQVGPLFLVEHMPRARISKTEPFDRPSACVAVFDGAVLSHNDVLDLRDHAGRDRMSIVTMRPDESQSLVELFDIVLRVREDQYTHQRVISVSENRLGMDAVSARYDLMMSGFVLVGG